MLLQCQRQNALVTSREVADIYESIRMNLMLILSKNNEIENTLGEGVLKKTLQLQLCFQVV